MIDTKELRNLVSFYETDPAFDGKHVITIKLRESADEIDALRKENAELKQLVDLYRGDNDGKRMDNQ